MRHQRRLLILLSGGFVLLLVAVYFQGQWLSQPIPARPAPITPTERDPLIPTRQPRTAQDLAILPQVFPALAAADIQSLRLAAPGGDPEFVMQRDGPAWASPNPDVPLDADTANLIAETVSILPYVGQLQPDPQQTNMADYGFITTNPLAIIIEFTLQDGTEHRVFVGGLDQTQQGIYAIVDDRAGFYLLEPTAIAFLQFQLTNPPIRLTTP
jgi:hypothetical protein